MRGNWGLPRACYFKLLFTFFVVFHNFGYNSSAITSARRKCHLHMTLVRTLMWVNTARSASCRTSFRPGDGGGAVEEVAIVEKLPCSVFL